MRSEVRGDMTDSAYDFGRVVWPAIAEPIGGGRCLSIEHESMRGNVLAQPLDGLASLDCLHIQETEHRMRGMATRIQWCDKSWDSFTVRHERSTGAIGEYEKLAHVLTSPGFYLYPALWIHAYLSEPRRQGHLLAVGVCYTRNLWQFISGGFAYERQNPADGNTFYVVPWDRSSPAHRADLPTYKSHNWMAIVRGGRRGS